jgi:hypothetical protein
MSSFPNPKLDASSLRQGLRKSISVDSFVRDGPASQSRVTRSSRTNTMSTPQGPMQPSVSTEDLLRSRVDSAPTKQPDRSGVLDSRVSVLHSPTVSESDTERSDPVISPVGGLSRLDTATPVQAGELPLPPRTNEITTPGLSTNANTTGIPTESHQGSLLPPSRPTVVTAGRTRSGSLGVYSTSNTVPRRLPINTQIQKVCVPRTRSFHNI